MHLAPYTLRRVVTAATVALLATAVGCAPQPEESAAKPTGTAGASCAKGELATQTTGKLTVATDEPAYEPWFKDDKPANGKGFESAVAYAVADALGYDKGARRVADGAVQQAFAPGREDLRLRHQPGVGQRRRVSGPWTSRRATTTCGRPSSR